VPKPYHVTLVRHGQSASNADPKVHDTVPDHRIDLTDLGKQQALDFGQAYWKAVRARHVVPAPGRDGVAVYLSPYRRTRATWAQISAELPVGAAERVYEDVRLREQEWGQLTDSRHHDIEDERRNSYGRFYYRLPDGESGADVYDRASGFLNTLYRDFEAEVFPQEVLIVTHGFTMRVLLMKWLHLSVEEFEALPNPPNCGSFTLELAYDRYRLLDAL
jgi:broad specificity phosphatase PhoE